MFMENNVTEHGYYEVYCSVFDERSESDDKGPYSVTIDILADEERLDNVQSNMSEILASINDKEGEEYARDAEYIQGHFRGLMREGLILDVLVNLEGVDDSAEALREALDSGKLQFVQ